MAGAWRGGVQVKGLRELQRAFRRIGGDLPKATDRALREIASPVRALAISNIEHKTGRHGDPKLPHLAETIRIGRSAKALSVYSNLIYSRIQDEGGRVGHGAIITRASASAYMTKAEQESRPAVEAALGHLGDRIEREFLA